MARRITSVKVETVKRLSEVLGIEGDTVTKARVTYLEYNAITTAGDESHRRHKPIEGKTYTLQMVNGELLVTDAAGAAPPAREAELVASEHRHFGAKPPLLAALPSNPVRIGDSLPELAEGIVNALYAQTAHEMTVSSSEIVVKSVTVDTVTFDVTLTLERSVPPQFTMTLNLAGSLAVRVADGKLMELVLAGPLETASPEADPSTPTSGTLSATVSASYGHR